MFEGSVYTFTAVDVETPKAVIFINNLQMEEFIIDDLTVTGIHVIFWTNNRHIPHKEWDFCPHMIIQ